ncbi:MAG: hypothetical protein M1269_01735 [Chloroflexi bacterium]|nr:hypothetical protein [Chloroflexota bacterium]
MGSQINPIGNIGQTPLTGKLVEAAPAKTTPVESAPVFAKDSVSISNADLVRNAQHAGLTGQAVKPEKGKETGKGKECGGCPGGGKKAGKPGFATRFERGMRGALLGGLPSMAVGGGLGMLLGIAGGPLGMMAGGLAGSAIGGLIGGGIGGGIAASDNAPVGKSSWDNGFSSAPLTGGIPYYGGGACGMGMDMMYPMMMGSTMAMTTGMMMSSMYSPFGMMGMMPMMGMGIMPMMGMPFYGMGMGMGMFGPGHGAARGAVTGGAIGMAGGGLLGMGLGAMTGGPLGAITGGAIGMAGGGLLGMGLGYGYGKKHG